VIPNALTKHAAARPLVKARAAAMIPRNSLYPPEEACIAPRNKDCRVSHSLTNPFSGGRADIAIAPSRNRAPVQGMFLMSPPIFSISLVPVALYTAPAPRNNSPLNAAWFTR